MRIERFILQFWGGRGSDGKERGLATRFPRKDAPKVLTERWKQTVASWRGRHAAGGGETRGDWEGRWTRERTCSRAVAKKVLRRGGYRWGPRFFRGVYSAKKRG